MGVWYAFVLGYTFYDTQEWVEIGDLETTMWQIRATLALISMILASYLQLLEDIEV